MTHDELLAKIKSKKEDYYADDQSLDALRAVVELHKPSIKNDGDTCECDIYDEYMMGYPCETIKAIEKELL